ncbi:MAG: type II secretion system F family protein [Desulfobacterales bacterium]|jgi:type IV pilus assembly protein PilC|nr:type II secretion system F family protein [Desulfobacterales bacterium]
MQYTYKAISPAGTEVSGVIRADSLEAAQDKLVSQGLIPSSVRPGTAAAGQGWIQRLNFLLATVKTPDLIIFTKQFRTLFKAGINMIELLEVMEQQTENLRLKHAAAVMGQDIRSGLSLTAAFKKHPKIFTPLYCSMIQAGESSGHLVEVLERLIYLLQHEHKIRSDIKSALQYPILVLVTLTGAFFFLLTFVIPRFVRIFESAGLDLPLPTRINILLYQWLIVYWPVSLSILVITLVALRFYLKTETGQYQKDYLLLRLPILGTVFQKGAMSRFASIFSILQASGVSVLDAFSILAGVIGNSVIAKEFSRIQEHLKEGRGIAAPLRTAKFFTPMVINMVAIGEETGNLDQMLHEVTVHYDDEVSYSVSRMSETIGPVLIVLLAAVVGFFALSIFLPMWDLVKTVR